MQQVLDRLNVPLVVVLTPSLDAAKHGEIDMTTHTLLIYDTTEHEAWQTLYHEALEYRFKTVTLPLWEMVNALIGVVEKFVYAKKEEFFEFIPKIERVITEVREKGCEQANE